MGDTVKMVQSTALDGKGRMLRWDFEASGIAEDILREKDYPPEERNFLTGVAVDTFDTTKIGVLYYAMLASWDYSRGRSEPTLSLREVRQKITPRITGDLLADIGRAFRANNPEPAEAKDGEQEEEGNDGDGQAGKEDASR